MSLVVRKERSDGLYLSGGQEAVMKKTHHLAVIVMLIEAQTG